MTAAFFDYPKAAAFGRVVPKSRIYECQSARKRDPRSASERDPLRCGLCR